jgi:hypothetical protein
MQETWLPVGKLTRQWKVPHFKIKFPSGNGGFFVATLHLWTGDDKEMISDWSS